MNRSKATKTPMSAPLIIKRSGKYKAAFFSFHVAAMVTGNKNVVSQTIGKDRPSMPTLQWMPRDSIQTYRAS